MVNSPLRYPGGKSALTDRIRQELSGRKIYAEPFAGGAGVAINLLLSGNVREILLNDADPAIFSIWRDIVLHTDGFISAIRDIPVTMDERARQRRFYFLNRDKPSFDLGVAAYFLNRTNVSGVIMGGPMGGMSQKGEYKLDCRFNKDRLIEKIRRIGEMRDRIFLSNYDFSVFLDGVPVSGMFVYADPPYVNKGKLLYRNCMSADDHVRLRDSLSKLSCPCLVSYDDCAFIRDLYKDFDIEPVYLNYSAANKGKSREILIRNILA